MAARFAFVNVIVWAALSPCTFGDSGNLMRNGAFQDDWITLLPETKNHHWCYSSEFYNRRDYNPDGWFCAGNWKWAGADAALGRRGPVVISGPGATLRQRVNWVLVHDDRAKDGFPDAGGFPSTRPQQSPRPLRV